MKNRSELREVIMKVLYQVFMREKILLKTVLGVLSATLPFC